MHAGTAAVVVLLLYCTHTTNKQCSSAAVQQGTAVLSWKGPHAKSSVVAKSHDELTHRKPARAMYRFIWQQQCCCLNCAQVIVSFPVAHADTAVVRWTAHKAVGQTAVSPFTTKYSHHRWRITAGTFGLHAYMKYNTKPQPWRESSQRTVLSTKDQIAQQAS